MKNSELENRGEAQQEKVKVRTPVSKFSERSMLQYTRNWMIHVYLLIGKF